MSFYNTLITPYEVMHEMKGIEGTSDDALMLKFINDVSAQIAQYADRHFVPRITTRYYDGYADVDGLNLVFDADWLALTTITNGDATTVAATAYVTEPRNEPPYRSIKLKSSVGLTWTYQTDPENAISVLGVTGYHTEYADAWVSTTTTSATAGTTGDITVTGTLYAGQLVKIDSEYVYVTTQSTTAGVTVCGRGSNGSTAETHESGVTVYVWHPVYIIRELAREAAAALYRLRSNPLAEAYTAQDGTQFVTPKDVGKYLQKRVVELGVKRN